MTKDGPLRLRWMDTLRGLAILLVVIWHSVAIPALFGYEIPIWVRSLNDFFLPFRMPTLMFLSGFLLHKSLRKPLRQYYLGKLKMLVWPYLIWALIHMITYDYPLAMSNPRAWIATGYLWFLFYITCFYFMAPATRAFPPWLVAGVMAAGSFAAPEGLVKHFLYFGLFFFVGHWAGTQSSRFERIIRSRWMLPIGVTGICFGAVCAVQGELLAYRAELAVFSIFGILGLVWISQAIDRHERAKSISFIGERSLVFYVSHFPIILGVFYLYRRFGEVNILTMSALGILAALAGGWVMARWHRTTPIRWLFQAPNFALRPQRRLADTKARPRHSSG